MFINNLNQDEKNYKIYVDFAFTGNANKRL